MPVYTSYILFLGAICKEVGQNLEFVTMKIITSHCDLTDLGSRRRYTASEDRPAVQLYVLDCAQATVA